MTPEQFLDSLMERLALLGLQRSRRYIRPTSKTLARGLTVRKDGPGKYVITVPHYWAIMVHNGRRPFSKQQLMVWYKNPSQDPRTRGGYPVRVRDRRRLTKAQFQSALRAGRLVLTRRITKATPAKPFLSNEPGGGMAGFKDDANRIGAKEVRKLVKQSLGDDLRIKEKTTIYI